MAHYALLNESNVVTQVITGKDEGDGGIDWEQHYGEFHGQVCKRTSLNTFAGVHLKGGVPYRKNYAGIGYTYDAVRDAFIPPQPFPSWQLNEDTCLWQAPVPMPTDGALYEWNEATVNWVPVA